MVVQLKITCRLGNSYLLPCEKISIFRKRNSAAGKLSFSFFRPGLSIEMGSLVTVHINQTPLFVGYVFSNTTSSHLSTLIAFDQIQYLLYQDSRKIEQAPISLAITQILQEKGLHIGNIEPSHFILDSKVFHQTTYLDMINHCIHDALLYQNQDFSFYDFNGEVHFRRCDELLCPIVLKENHNILSFELSQEIFSNTFNQIKIERPNKKLGISDIILRGDDRTQSVWGTLSYHKKVSEKTTDGEINQLVHNFLVQKNMETTYLLITCIGDVSLYVGHVVQVQLPSLSIHSFFIIEEISHLCHKGKFICSLKLKYIHNNR